MITCVGGSVGATASFGGTAGTQQHTRWKGQERGLHPDDLLKRKHADRAVLGGLAERIGAGTGTLAMVAA